MKKFSILTFVLFLFISSIEASKTRSKIKNVSKISKINFNEMNSRTASSLCKRHNMSFTGSGYSLVGGYNMLSLSFKIQGVKNKNQLRKIIVDCLHEYLSEINNCPEIQKDLSKSPYLSNDIILTIAILDENNNTLFFPEISSVSFSKNRITFRTNDPLKKFATKTTERETYQESLKILKQEEEKFLYSKELTDEEFKDEEKHINHFFYEFAKPK